MAASPTPVDVAEDVQRLGTLAMRFRGTRAKEERREIADEYSQTVERLIASGCWNEMPVPEDQLPDTQMPRSFFDFWIGEGDCVNQMPITMSGTATFNAFSYLFEGAHSLARTAKDNDVGSHFCRISAVAFSAFAIEAHLNHIGEAKLPFWAIVEPKLSWQAKLDLIVTQFNITPDFGKRPFQTLRDLFKFRNGLAHGKTTTEEKSYEYRGTPEDDFGPLDPEWVKKYWSDEAVERALEDTRQIIELLHTKAGFELHSLHLIASGEFGETNDKQAEPDTPPDRSGK